VEGGGRGGGRRRVEGAFGEAACVGRCRSSNLQKYATTLMFVFASLRHRAPPNQETR